MVLNVSSLLKTVKAVEDEHTRGTRAMEATVEAISQEIRVIVHFLFLIVIILFYNFYWKLTQFLNLKLNR